MRQVPTVEFLAGPNEFLDAARDYLLARPVAVNVVVSVASGTADRQARGEPFPEGTRYHWYAVVREAGDVVGAAMRTAPFDPYPIFCLPMPATAALALADAIAESGEPVTAVYGATAVAEPVFERLTGRPAYDTAVDSERLRLHEVTSLVAPASVPGALRSPVEPEFDLLASWLTDFDREADLQGGRPAGSTPHPGVNASFVADRTARRELWVWDDGGPVHVSASRGPNLGVARIGPVYTPPELRGRGYAAATVAEISRRLLDGGARVCLYTDLANPTSNALYERLGFTPVMDSVQLRLRR